MNIEDSKSWITTEWEGAFYRVPATGRDENMNAMLTTIPGDDGVAFDEKMFEAHAWAFLMQDGNLGVPGGRYGSDTRSCAPVAIALAKIMQYANGEPITYYQLDSDMGLVVNSSDDVAYSINQYAELVDLDPEELLSEEDYVPTDMAKRLAKHLRYGTVREYAHGTVLELNGHECEELLMELTDEDQE